MVVERTKFWTKERDDYLRQNYDAEKMRVDPAILAMNLHTRVDRVVNRLSELKLRRRLRYDVDK
jgi:hypothetical protein